VLGQTGHAEHCGAPRRHLATLQYMRWPIGSVDVSEKDVWSRNFGLLQARSSCSSLARCDRVDREDGISCGCVCLLALTDRHSVFVAWFRTEVSPSLPVVRL